MATLRRRVFLGQLESSQLLQRQNDVMNYLTVIISVVKTTSRNRWKVLEAARMCPCASTLVTDTLIRRSNGLQEMMISLVSNENAVLSKAEFSSFFF